MARPSPITPVNTNDSGSTEWEALRGDLVTLLEQVEGRYAQAGMRMPDYQRLSERVRSLKDQVGETEPSLRHKEALKSVKRAVDRFTERPEDLQQSSNPQDSLRAAIAEIRSKQRPTLVPPPEPAPVAPAPKTAPAPAPKPELDLQNEIELQAQPQLQSQPAQPEPEIAEMTHLIDKLAGRLGAIEGELKVQGTRGHGGEGEVRAIAEQVTQLSNAVELLAGAVGETGQVKQLETQMVGLARMIQDSPKADFSAVDARLADLARTVERLADIQVEAFGRAKEQGPAQQALIRNGFEAIEASVRTVYDRIDALEHNYALPAQDFERLTSEMAAFTAAMRIQQGEPEQLLARLDTLQDRIEEIAGNSAEIRELQSDLFVLRDSVLDAFEPRFSALEMQIEKLGDRVALRGEPVNVSILESQVRLLAERMEQTGEQLTGLAKLYAESEERAPDFETLAEMVVKRSAPDYDVLAHLVAKKTSPHLEALADIVATRTSEAVAQNIQPAYQPPQSLSQDNLAELESRMSRLFRDASDAVSQPDLSRVQDEIRKVDERLERLEAALKPSAEKHEPEVERNPLLQGQLQPMLQRVEPRRANDAMPLNPSENRPLTVPGFPAGGLVLPPAINSASPIHSQLEAKQGEEAFIFDETRAEHPPRPSSPFAETESEPVMFTEAAASSEVPVAPVAEVRASSRNTFIEAARRAQQKQQASQPETGKNSLIERALSRFQAGRGQNAAPTETTPQSSPKPSARATEPTKADDAAMHPAIADIGKQSFLLRHRQPILLAASLVAVSLLTLNLIGQRLADDSAPMSLPETVIEAPADLQLPPSSEAPVELPAEPVTEPTALVDPLPVIEQMPQLLAADSASQAALAVDATTVGAIDPTVITADLTSQSPDLALPDTLRPAGDAQASAPLESKPLEEVLPSSPVAIELPPEQVGPEALRQAAANGDARAQFEVAAIYSEGQAVSEDLEAAAVWYERSAAQGFAPAEYRLGSLYEGGKGVTQDFEQARLWYTRAAEAGNRMSMHNLAALYASGQLGTQQFDIAAQWFEQAASRGLNDSQFNLGMLYARGLGVTQDFEQSFKWFSIAAMNGDQGAATARDDIARNLDAETVASLTQEIAAWRPVSLDLAANFAPIGTWSESFDPGAQITDRDLVGKVQIVLGRLGYDVGTPDGLAGPRTEDAIKAFERATGMSESGQINPRLLAVLGSQPV